VLTLPSHKPTPFPRGACVFCGAQNQISAEHALPKWIEQVLPGSGDFTTSVGDLWSKTSPSIDQKIKRVCVPCNTGWMHDLEVACKPILTPAIRLEGAPYVLSEVEQRSVALWVAKTALMVEFVHGGDPHVPPRHYRHVYDNRTPPLGCIVWLAAYGATNHLFQVTPKKLYMRDRWGNSTDGYLVTFSVGHLACQFAYFGGSGEMEPLGESRLLNRIWPVRGPQSWPPAGVVLPDDALSELAGRFGE
jgi:hypothetical protein